MSLNVSGLVIVIEEPVYKNVNGGWLATFKCLSPSNQTSTKQIKSVHNTTLWIPTTEIEIIKSRLRVDKLIYIRNGEWIAEEKEWKDKLIIINNLSLKTSDIMFLKG
jgi:hypothetical protein